MVSVGRIELPHQAYETCSTSRKLPRWEQGLESRQLNWLMRPIGLLNLPAMITGLQPDLTAVAVAGGHRGWNLTNDLQYVELII